MFFLLGNGFQMEPVCPMTVPILVTSHNWKKGLVKFCYTFASKIPYRILCKNYKIPHQLRIYAIFSSCLKKVDPIFRHLFQHSAVLLWIFFLIPLRVLSISDSVPQVLCENGKAMNSFDFCFSNACLFSQQIALAIYKKLHSLCH